MGHVFRGSYFREVRLLGPVLAQTGLLSIIMNWGGRPTDTLMRATQFLGLPTTWIDSVRNWFDDPIRHESMITIVFVIAGFLMFSLARWAGGWHKEEETYFKLIERAGDDEAAKKQVRAQNSQYNVQRSSGTGTSTWMSVALLLELQAVTVNFIIIAAPVVILSMSCIALFTHFHDETRSGLSAASSAKETLLNLATSIFIALGIWFIAPEGRVLTALVHAPSGGRSN